LYCSGQTVSSRDQLAGIENGFRGQRLDLRLAHGDHGDGFAQRVEHFKGVARLLAGAATMIFNNGRHVPAPQTMAGKAGLQRNPAEHFKFHVLSGYNVTNFAAPPVFSIIQIETTRNPRPLGPFNRPRMTYFSPYSPWSRNSTSSGSNWLRKSFSIRRHYPANNPPWPEMPTCHLPRATPKESVSISCGRWRCRMAASFFTPRPVRIFPTRQLFRQRWLPRPCP